MTNLERLPWKCPVCGENMTCHTGGEQGKPQNLICPNRHSFDIARQGYVNLLLPQKRGAALPGDNTDMVRARTAFLSGGYYEPFSNGINALAAEALDGVKSPVLADAGCGEGYYTGRLCRFLLEKYPDVSILGGDLSKDAVLHGAKCARAEGIEGNVSYTAASLFEMPLQSGVCDGILNLFAPVADAEFARLLKPGGFLLMAVPAERHLFGLKAAVYENPYENEVRRDTLKHFTLKEVRRVSYEMTLRTREDIAALFLMTPYYWKTSRTDREKLDQLDTLRTEAAFDLLLYRKN